MRSNLPFDDYTNDEPEHGAFRVWSGYNTAVDLLINLFAVGITLALKGGIYLAIIAALVAAAIYCAAFVASLLSQAFIGAPAAIYDFVAAIAQYPVKVALSVAFLHLFIRWSFTAPCESVEPDQLIRGSRIEGSLEDSFEYSSDSTSSEKRLWIFPGRRWLTKEERYENFQALLRAIQEGADILSNKN